MYEFSIPMPYTIDDIDRLMAINKKIEKSQITSLYFSLPSSCELFTGFEQYRNGVQGKNWDYWKKLIEHSLSYGVDFIYLLNSPNRLPVENPDFEQRLEKLDKLLNELRNIGVNKLRIAEHKLLSYISDKYRDFDIYSSTSFELQTIAQYQNFMFMHPKVKQIVPSHDSIKNFMLLKNIKKLFPNVEIELMVNEGCINGCPNRYGHAGEFMDKFFQIKNTNISNDFFTKTFCHRLEKQNTIFTLVKSNIIYPWEIDEYSKIGINKLKFVGRDGYSEDFNRHLNHFYLYLKGIDNVKNIENSSIDELIHHLFGSIKLNNLKVKDIKNLLPNISHFKKHGNLCATNCGISCNYCYKCAEKIEKLFIKKQSIQKEKKKVIQPVCISNRIKVT